MFTNCTLPPQLFSLVIGINKHESHNIPNLAGAVSTYIKSKNTFQFYGAFKISARHSEFFHL